MNIIFLVGCLLSQLSSSQQTCTSGAECSTSDPDSELQVSLLQTGLEVQKVVQADESAANSASSRSSLAAQVIAINQRFKTGRPSNNLTEAGVFAHNVDFNTEAGCFHCKPLFGFDRLSGSLINARVPYTFLGLYGSVPITHNSTIGSAGVIYTPSAVAASLRCSFPTDASTDVLSTPKSSEYWEEVLALRKDLSSGARGAEEARGGATLLSKQKGQEGQEKEKGSGPSQYSGGCVGFYGGRLNPYWDGESQRHSGWRREMETNVENQIDRRTAWCSNDTDTEANVRLCARKPQDLQAMLEDQERKNEEILKSDPEGHCKQTCCLLGERKGPSRTHCRLYNEVVLDYELLSQQPGFVEGIYYVTDSAARNRAQAHIGEKLARSFVRQWKKAYGIEVPLMKVRDFNLPEPFEHVETTAEDYAWIPPQPVDNSWSWRTNGDLRLVQNKFSSSRPGLPLKMSQVSQDPQVPPGMHFEIFLWVLLGLACTVPLLLMARHNNGPTVQGILLAVLACLYFGMENFIFGFAGMYGMEVSDHITMTFAIEAMIAFTLHSLLIRNSKSYQAACVEAVSSNRSGVLFVLLAGLSIGLAQYTASIGFSIDEESAGPHQALVCLESLIVGSFFYWYANESITMTQLASFVVMVAGAVVMSDPGSWYSQEFSIAAIAWLIVSMLCYASSVIFWRLASTDKGAMPWQPRILLIYGIIGCLGVMPCLVQMQWPWSRWLEHPLLLAWPLLNAVVSILGMWCINLAFGQEQLSTCVMVAIVDSNSAVLMLMNMAVLHLVPSTTKLIGMGLILFAAISMACAELLQPRSEHINEAA
jgi:hypothetical protein